VSRCAATAFAIAIATAGLSAVEPAGAADSGPLQVPLRDPWVPPQVASKAASEAPTPRLRGADLQKAVDARLHALFDAADVAGRGSLTREQAQAGGLGIIARNFERIDVARHGRVTYEDFRAFLRGRAAGA